MKSKSCFFSIFPPFCLTRKLPILLSFYRTSFLLCDPFYDFFVSRSTFSSKIIYIYIHKMHIYFCSSFSFFLPPFVLEWSLFIWVKGDCRICLSLIYLRHYADYSCRNMLSEKVSTESLSLRVSFRCSLVLIQGCCTQSPQHLFLESLYSTSTLKSIIVFFVFLFF